MEEIEVNVFRDVEPMSAVDRAWLEMDDPRNPMVVSAVLELSQVRNVEALVRHMLANLLRYRRFAQRVDDSRNPPVWRKDGDLLLSYHVRIFHLNEDCPEHDIAHAVARELAHPLDRMLPLWRITLFVREGGRVTVLFRAHHALADGIALVRVLMSMTDQKSGTHEPEPLRNGPLMQATERVRMALARARDIGELLADADRRRAYVSEQIKAGRETMAAVGRVLALPENNPPRLRKPLAGQRAVAWTDSLAFAPVRSRARRLGVKINDLFVTALAGALGRYLADSQGGYVDPEQNLRISIPVNLRAPDDCELGNCFGLVLLDLPVGVEDWRARLRAVSQRMQALKGSAEARAVMVGLAAAGHMPVTWEKTLVNLLAGKAAAVVSNLPGPKRKLRVAGARLESVVFWPPQAGGIGIGISLFSYAGRVSVGVSADTALIPDPARLIAAFEAELAQMLHPRKRERSAEQPAIEPRAPLLLHTETLQVDDTAPRPVQAVLLSKRAEAPPRRATRLH